MSKYSPVWPHGDIINAFENIYVVRGTNKTCFEDKKIQHSRNMTIIASNNNLTLINTVRLNEKGLQSLNNLGTVKHIISIGAFHGRDDEFYLDKYKAQYWSVQSGEISHPAHYLHDKDKLPIPNGCFFKFKNSSPAEGYIYIERQDGIIITCDSIKNWVEIDSFFNEETAIRAISQGEISKARISPIWLNATGVTQGDFDCLLKLKFKHLISAHGDVLRDTAYEDVKKSVGAITKN
ncbi:hypothetical protein OQJ18_04355 [Fluoribacter dumoffii]|uniref:hypothetical protein n=1 Tax=Fluoribacter dumoffii TaxID=463 RepID=UPI0022433053|nr:hypothetical protein [Fluoribacter dumoffii]MCW8418682.1 hypothetical protein [Fluoribacter dumoffii]MCW8453474.1 hypothetical protein [Fluoribacter dumoffii]MCW8459306.1 hypothetical protein [Fluoribacter dumoffii]MCW8482665.1 hypothetical protein [Fluoribacter dumoffii]